MKLLLDQGLPRSVAIMLRELDMDVSHVGEMGLATAEDETILDKARQDEYIIVTLDADFHALLALSNSISPSVIRIRIEGLKAEDISKLLQKILQDCYDDLAHGAMVTVQEHRIRIRRLPLLAN